MRRATEPTRSTMTWPDGLNPAGLGTYRTEVAGARRGVEAQKQPSDGDHVVLHKRLEGDIWAGSRRKGLLSYSLGDAKGWRQVQGCITQSLLGSHLVEQRVQHADAEDPPGREGQPEHEGQVGAILSLFLEEEGEDVNTHRQTALAGACSHPSRAFSKEKPLNLPRTQVAQKLEDS